MKYFLLLYFFINGYYTSAQFQVNFASKISPGILWLGVENKVTLTGDTSYKNIFLQADGVEFKSGDETFLAIVKTLNDKDTVRISAYRITRKDTVKIVTKKYVVKQLPAPAFYIGGKIITNSISKKALLKDKKIKVALGVLQLDTFFVFKLVSFDMELDGKIYHSNSSSLAPEILKAIASTKSDSLRIFNDNVWLKSSGEVHPLYDDKIFVLEK